MIQYWTLTLFRHVLTLAGACLRLVYGKPSNSAHLGDLLFDGHQNLCHIRYCILRSRSTNHTWTNSSPPPNIFCSYERNIFSFHHNELFYYISKPLTTVNLKSAFPIQADRHQFSDFAPTYIFQ